MSYKPFWKKAGIPETSKLFEACKDDLKGDEKYMQMVEKIFSWDFKNPASITILSKANGCGKSHIAVCLLKKYIHEKYTQYKSDIEEEDENLRKELEHKAKVEFEKSFSSIVFKKESLLYYEILATFKKDSKRTEEDIINEYSNLEFLVIDDLFSTRENEFARRVIFSIVDLRIDWLNKPTVITSNKILDDIDDIDSRIASRIDNNFLFQISENAKDWRK